MKTHKTADEAIRYSEQYGEISYCEATRENRERLLAASDNHHSGNSLEDYWADDPDSDHKMLWRVYIATLE